MRRCALALLFLVIALLAPAQSAGQAIYTPAGVFGSYVMGDPLDIALDSGGNVFVTDVYRGGVAKFGPDGTFLGLIGNGLMGTTTGLAIDPVTNYLYVADYGYGVMRLFDAAGNYLSTFGGSVYLPYGMAFSPLTDHLFITENHSFVVECDASGTGINVFGSLADCVGLTFDRAGYLYCGQDKAGAVQVFAPDRTLVRTIGTPGSGDGQLSRPQKVALDSHGNVFVSDYGASRIVEFDANGDFLQNIGTGILTNPAGIVIDPYDNIIIVDRGTKRILTFTPAQPTSLTLSATTTAGGTSLIGKLALTGPPPVAINATLSSSNPGVASVQSRVAFAPGVSTALFTVNVAPVSSPQTVTIFASYGGATKSIVLNVKPAALSALTLSPSNPAGGQTSTGTVTMSGPVAASTTVTLTSSDPSVAQVPGSVTLSTGATMGTFPIQTSAVAATHPVTITATYSGVKKTSVLTVQPIVLSAMTLSHSAVLGGTANSGKVTVSSTIGAIVALSSSNPSVVQVPDNIAVAQASSTATFAITTSPVLTDQTVTISATLGGITKTQTLTVHAPVLAGFTLSHSSVVGGTTSAGKVSLSGMAPAGVVVTLTSSNTAVVPNPGSVTVTPGATTAPFDIPTLSVTATQTVTITATYGTVSIPLHLTVTAHH